MVRRLLVIAAAALLAACAATPQAPVAQNPHFDGIYRLSYSNTGGALYYRFYPEGIVLSARSEAPATDVVGTLTLENANTSRGTWSATNGELKVGVNEGTVWYDSRFDINGDGRIALRGLPRNFEFLPTDRDGNIAVSSR
ncbi:MAG: hypothetical protein ACOY3X_10830 [Pseudomonadota bacterium]